MADTPQFLQERLLSEAEKTLIFFRELPEEDWQKTIYTEGSRWTVRQVLAHFAATEESINRLIENILAGGEGAPEDFNIDVYNERKVASLNEEGRAELMQRFKSSRQKNADLVAKMSLDDLTKTGRHPYFGNASLTDIIKLLYRHNQIHLRDIRRELSQRRA